MTYLYVFMSRNIKNSGIPRLAPWFMSKVKEAVVREWIVPPKGEFRFEVSFYEAVLLKLVSGTAEIYGSELAPGRDYELTGVKYAVFSYEGAVLQVKGVCEVEYVSEEAPTMPVYLSTHFAVEGLREKAASQQDEAPRILLVGSSRHTLATILSNYAVRSGKCPLLVDLDTNRGSVLFPGTLAAQHIDRVMDPEEGCSFGDAGRCSYFYGHQLPSDNPKMYSKLMERLAFAVNSRLAASEDSNKSGAIIIAPASITEHLGTIREAFRASLIIVIGNERLHSTIVKAEPTCTVLKVPLSGGYVQLDSSYRRSLAQHQFKAYFYGPRQEYTPFSQVLPFEDLQLRRLGEEALAPSSALPIGATRKVSETRTSRVDPGKSLLLYSILAVPNAQSEEDDQLSNSNIAGYLYVTAVDETKKQVTLLSPCPGKLPSPFLLVSSIKWLEK